jgi:hypothetical protein
MGSLAVCGKWQAVVGCRFTPRAPFAPGHTKGGACKVSGAVAAPARLSRLKPQMDKDEHR